MLLDIALPIKSPITTPIIKTTMAPIIIPMTIGDHPLQSEP